MNPPRIGVIGAGVMGVGVAQVLAETGHQVVLVDVDTKALARAREEIDKGLKLSALFNPQSRGANRAQVLKAIAFATNLDGVADVSFLIENVTESPVIKEPLYRRLDEVCKPECIFAANTSAIPIARLARSTSRPDRVIGLHFMNPVPRKEFVEVIVSEHTSQTTVALSLERLRLMNKKGLVVKDSPGFVSNRVLMLAINEAIALVQEGVADARGVDEIFVKCIGQKMGPLATADLIGLDTVLKTLEFLHESYAAGKYSPSALLVSMVAKGRLGRKTGAGFFDYEGSSAR